MSKAVCPICKKQCERYPKNALFPFCSKQCKLADLGNWLDGRYVAPATPDEPGDEELDAEGRTLH